MSLKCRHASYAPARKDLVTLRGRVVRRDLGRLWPFSGGCGLVKYASLLTALSVAAGSYAQENGQSD